MTDHKQPTDHLPPASERDADDDRTTSGQPFPVDGAVEEGGVSPDTAAEPSGPDRLSSNMQPPGAR